MQAQLVAADAMRFAFYSHFLVMLKSDDVDVLIVGKYIHDAHKFLTTVSTEEESASQLLHGETILYGSHFGSD
ncbi:hypothetical protein LSAT2_006602, partial [Lamellibrachia satsuma]